jgi:antitoxin StbD
MDEILTKKSTSITAFKANPNREVKAAGNKPFCVLTNNKPSFYVLSPKAYDELLEYIWELKSAPEILAAAGEAAIPVNIDELLAGRFDSLDESNSGDAA